MAFSIQQIKKTKADKPERILLHGRQKIGKSTFGSNAPRPIFIPTEDGQDAIEADAFPLCRSWNDVMGAVATLYSEPHDFKTAVLDSADWAEKLLHKHVCEQAGVKSIEQVEKGFGKGYVRAAEVFGELLDGLNALRNDRNMRVIVICHTEIKRFQDPLSDSYDRFQLKLHERIGKALQEWADNIGFAQVETLTRVEDMGFNKERTRALSADRRIINWVGSPAFDAGNRYGLPAVTDLAWVSYEEAMNAARNPASEATK